MAFPDDFAAVKPLTLYDPLAELLGAPVDGRITYTFADVVKLAGHACPTVAGAWTLTVRALKALYGDALPQRGQIAVALPDHENSGVTGVIASVAGMLTGAAGEGGFKGLGGQHVRRGLLRFGIEGVQGVAFSRTDTQATVDCRLNLQTVPGDPEMAKLLPAIIQGDAGPAERQAFAHLWQARVRAMLIDHADDPALVDLRYIKR